MQEHLTLSTSTDRNKLQASLLEYFIILEAVFSQLTFADKGNEYSEYISNLNVNLFFYF